MDSVGDVMQAQLDEVRRVGAQYADAKEVLREREAKLRALVIQADAAGVPKSAIAAAAKVSRPTIYAWLGQGS
jgi:spore germination cell wall hydrolase CwlJ-like protein